MKYPFLGILLLFLACSSPRKDPLLVAVASSLSPVSEKLIESFESDTGIEIEITTGSSGKLAAQILEGAPYDVFLSADTINPWKIYQVDTGIRKPEIYATGTLVCFTMIDPELLEPSMWLSEEVHHLAVANPDLAPYGKAAIAYLNSLEISDSLKDKLVVGENVSQTSNFVFSGAAEVGITAKSMVILRKESDLFWMEVDPDRYPVIFHAIVVVDGNNQNAQKFYDYIFSEQAQNTFLAYGFNKIPQP
jgi:molybdate transport system substrate-binding protein